MIHILQALERERAYRQKGKRKKAEPGAEISEEDSTGKQRKDPKGESQVSDIMERIVRSTGGVLVLKQSPKLMTHRYFQVWSSLCSATSSTNYGMACSAATSVNHIQRLRHRTELVPLVAMAVSRVSRVNGNNYQQQSTGLS